MAALVGYSEDWVRTIVHRYTTTGPAGVVDRRRANPGQRPLRTPELRSERRQALAADPPDGGLWTSPKVAAWMTSRLARAVSKQRAWEAMRSLGFSRHQPRPHATTADPAAQEAFNKGGSLLPWTG